MGKVIVCGREWCPECGQSQSEAHRRRYARALGKLQQMHALGVFTVTWPPGLRDGLRSPATLTRLGRLAVQVMREYGYGRGGKRWHWFGDPTCPGCGQRRHRQWGSWEAKKAGIICLACGLVSIFDESDPPYHPHLQLLVDGYFIPPSKLEAIKQALRDALGVEVIHYSYARAPGRMLHRLRYVTRATFRSYSWDSDLAQALHNFRNMSWWGTHATQDARARWDGDPVWRLQDLPAVDREEIAELAAIFRRECPICAGKLIFLPGVIDGWEVPAHRIGRGWISLRGPPAPIPTSH